MTFAVLRVAALAFVVTGLATAARAQTYIGYVQTLGGSISSAVSFNSAGGTNSLAVVGTGRYQVTLAGLGRNSHSPTHQDNLQVNAVATGGIQGNFCVTDDWDSSGPDMIAEVACFDASWQPAPSDFSMFYQRRFGPPPGGAIAFMETLGDLISPGTFYTPPNFYTSSGRLIGVTQTGTGQYDVLLRGFSRIANPQVTPELAGHQPPTRCEVADWYREHVATHVVVDCFSAAGLADTGFSLSYTSGTSEASGVAATELGAYAWADSAKRKNYVPDRHRQFNNISGGALTAQRSGGAGLYSLTVPNPSELPFNTILGMVTAVGSSGEYCENEGGVNVLSSEFYIDVVCYNASGAQVDTPYVATFITSQ